MSVGPGERAGIVGENGSGKSTLLRLLAGVERPDDGEVRMPDDFGYLGQTLGLPPEHTVQQAIDAALAGLRAMERRMRELESALTDEVMDEYGDLLTAYELRGGYEADARVDKAFHGLGLAHVGRDRPLSSLSGGERARLGLACVLAAAPRALLLDEPTNHLDESALTWLEDRLREHRGAVAVVSHDRVFLDRVATTILEVEQGTITRFGGGYTGFLAAKAAARARWEQAYAEWREEIRQVREHAATTAHRVAAGRVMRDNNKMAYDRNAGRVQSSVASRVRNAHERLRRLEADPVPRPPDPLRFHGTFTEDEPSEPELKSDGQHPSPSDRKDSAPPESAHPSPKPSTSRKAIAGFLKSSTSREPTTDLPKSSTSRKPTTDLPKSSTSRKPTADLPKSSPSRKPTADLPKSSTSREPKAEAEAPSRRTESDCAPAAEPSTMTTRAETSHGRSANTSAAGGEAPGQRPASDSPSGAMTMEGRRAGDTDRRVLAELRDVRVGDRLQVGELTIRAGERLLVRGANGAGKSTLLQAIAEHARTTKVGHLQQEVTFDPNLTVLAAYNGDGYPDERRAALLRTGLFRPQALDQKVGTLSVGQRRRLALATLLARPYDLLLLDEPTNHLSPVLAEELEQALDGYRGALVVVSHDRALTRRFRGTEIELTRGRIR
ncbi:ABC transporter [Nonomuraea solani]|uniref:ABC transporter n=2 Tax=Nonomuraea solani TaxID=1144553 RepID=A0A1H6DSY1_9ACTN|nr:ABC transporter [Nonomuraea solani]